MVGDDVPDGAAGQFKLTRDNSDGHPFVSQCAHELHVMPVGDRFGVEFAVPVHGAERMRVVVAVSATPNASVLLFYFTLYV